MCFACDVPLVAAKQLREWQRRALDTASDALSNGVRGVVWAVMGAGKSVVIAEIAQAAFKSGQHVVITVPTQALVDQLAEGIGNWTGQVVGRWYADVKDLWPITVVCQMSLATYEDAWQNKYIDGYQLTPERLWIADECHKTECDTVLEWNAPEMRIGFSATPWRAEMRESVSSFDEVLYEYGPEDAHRDGHIVKPTVEHPDAAGDTDSVVAFWILEQVEAGRVGVANASSIADAEQFAETLKKVGVPCMTTHSESQHDRDRARAALMSGRPGCVVYVDMLAEGFDAPPIEFMALRRAVGSRVRFAQEVGRGLRAHPGKTTCYMLDVWDLWNTHSMTWEAALGDVDDTVIPALKLDGVLEERPTQQWLSGELDKMPHEVLGPLRSWIRSTRVQLQFDGRIPSKEIASRHWRSDPCSRKQREYLDDIMRQVDPSELDDGLVTRVRAARAALVDSVKRNERGDDLDGAFRKGDASDLIDVLRGLG